MPEALRIFIAPPSAETLRTRLVGRGTDAKEQIDRRLAVRRGGARGAAGVPGGRRERPARGCDRRAHTRRPRGLSTKPVTPRRHRLADAAARSAAARATLWGMISPRVDKLLNHADSNYASVIVAAKRARQINAYYHSLGEGAFDEFAPPMVETASKKLPHDRARRGRCGQDRLPLPVVAGGAAAAPELIRNARPDVAGARPSPCTELCTDPPRRLRQHRRLQSARIRAPRHGEGPRRPRGPHDGGAQFVGRDAFAALTGAPV